MPTIEGEVGTTVGHEGKEGQACAPVQPRHKWLSAWLHKLSKTTRSIISALTVILFHQFLQWLVICYPVLPLASLDTRIFSPLPVIATDLASAGPWCVTGVPRANTPLIRHPIMLPNSHFPLADAHRIGRTGT